MSKTILIVENSALDAQLYRDILEAEGYTTVWAAEGAKGLHLAQEHRPDLILMDIGLSDVSGLEVIRWIKGERSLSRVPIVAVTGFTMEGDRERILESGCDGYVSKPISMSALLSAVHSFLPRPNL